MTYRVLDISSWQGTIRFDQVKASGVWGVMLKATEGTTYLSPSFLTNYQGAKQAGLHVGAYHFLRAGSAAQSAQEAAFFLSKVQGLELDLPLAVDIESAEQQGITDLSPLATAFCNAVQDAGYYAILYSTLYWFQTKLSSPILDRFDRWVAQIKPGITQPEFNKPYGMWQFTWTAQVPGITTNVDESVAYKDYPSIIRAAGLNHLPPILPPQETAVTVTQLREMGYTRLLLE